MINFYPLITVHEISRGRCVKFVCVQGDDRGGGGDIMVTKSSRKFFTYMSWNGELSYQYMK